MLDFFARLATERTRRILIIAGAVFLLAAAIGVPVVTILKSESSDFQDPHAQNQQVLRAVEQATGQSASYGVAALVSSKTDIRGDAAAQAQAAHVVALLSRQPGFQRALDYPTTHLPVLVSRDGHQTLVLAAFATRERSAEAVKAIRPQLAGSDVRLGGNDVAFQEINKRTSSDLAHCRGVRVPDPAAALFLGLPRSRRRRAAAAGGRVCDRDHVPAAALGRSGPGAVDLRGQPRHRYRARARHRLQPVHPLALSRGARPRPGLARGDQAHAADHRAHRAVRLADGRRSARLAARVPVAVSLLNGDRRCARHAVRGGRLADRAARGAGCARPTDQRARPRAAATQRGACGTAGRARRLVPARARGDAPPGVDRTGHSRGADRDLATGAPPAADPGRRARAAELRPATPGRGSDHPRLRRRWLPDASRW